jgi:hypothetical protein
MRANIVVGLITLVSVTSVALPTANGAEVLYGATIRDASGNASLVTVNTTTGVTTPLFSFPLSANFSDSGGIGGLAWDPAAGVFVYNCSKSLSTDTIAVIDPVTQSVTEHAVTGLPAGQFSMGGIEYDPAVSSLVVSFGTTSSSAQRRLAEISLSGVVSTVTGTLSPVDIDYLAFNPNNTKLALVDLNDIGVEYIDDPFGTPSYTPVAPNPNDTTYDDSAFNSLGSLFLGHGTAVGSNDLYQLQGTSYVKIGGFGSTVPIEGLAFANVPEPSPIYIALLLGAGFWVRRRHRLTA